MFYELINGMVVMRCADKHGMFDRNHFVIISIPKGYIPTKGLEMLDVGHGLLFQKQSAKGRANGRVLTGEYLYGDGFRINKKLPNMKLYVDYNDETEVKRIYPVERPDHRHRDHGEREGEGPQPKRRTDCSNQAS